MFHLFGIMHTQMRADRDQHITVLRQNIQRAFSQEYDVRLNKLQLASNVCFSFQICHECNDYGVPYDCSSIMHYGAETFSTGRWTMRAKSKVSKLFTLTNDIIILFQSCDLKWVGAAFDGRGASPNDWLLLRRVTKDMCNNRKQPRRLRNGKSLKLDNQSSSDDKFTMIMN